MGRLAGWLRNQGHSSAGTGHKPHLRKRRRPNPESAPSKVCSVTKTRPNGWLQFPLPEIKDAFRTNTINPFLSVPLLPLKQNHVLLLLPDELLECDLEKPDTPRTTILRAARETGLQKFSGMTPTQNGGLWISGVERHCENSGADSRFEAGFSSGTSIWFAVRMNSTQNLREPVEDDEGGVIALAESPDATKQCVARFDGQQWAVEASFTEKINQVWRGPDKIYRAITVNSLLELKPGAKEFSADELVLRAGRPDVAVEV